MSSSHFLAVAATRDELPRDVDRSGCAGAEGGDRAPSLPLPLSPERAQLGTYSVSGIGRDLGVGEVGEVAQKEH
jgi:hypothetical protein